MDQSKDEKCRVCGEDAELADNYGEPLCEKCYEENTSCCGDWIGESEMRFCPSCGEHC